MTDYPQASMLYTSWPELGHKAAWSPSPSALNAITLADSERSGLT